MNWDKFDNLMIKCIKHIKALFNYGANESARAVNCLRIVSLKYRQMERQLISKLR